MKHGVTFHNPRPFLISGCKFICCLFFFFPAAEAWQLHKEPVHNIGLADQNAALD